MMNVLNARLFRAFFDLMEIQLVPLPPPKKKIIIIKNSAKCLSLIMYLHMLEKHVFIYA